MKLIEKLYLNNMMNSILLNSFILITVGFTQSLGWQENGVPVRQGAHIEWSRTGDVGENGTMIFGWTDTRTGDRDIYAQKFDENGTKLWVEDGEDGLIVARYSSRQEDPIFISDDNGGVYVIWSDFRNEPMSDGQPFAQHITSDGILSWGENGLPLSDDKLTEFSLNLCRDGNGGAYATWKSKYGGHYASYLNINNSGPMDEVEVISNEWSHSHPSLETAGDGDAVMVWADERNDDKDIYGQRLGFDGTNVLMEWETIEDDDGDGEDNYPKGGIPIVSATGDQSSQKVTYYSEEYSVIVWQDERYNSAMPDIFATFIDAAGEPAALYGENGLPIASSRDENGIQQAQNAPHKKPRVKADNDGAMVIWNDFRYDASGDIYIQKITHESNGLWAHNSQLPFDGIVVSDGMGEQSNSRLTVDGNGGVYIVWENKPSEETDIYLQHLDVDGSTSFESDGLIICNAVNDQISPLVRIDGGGGVYSVWQDQREGSIGLFVQHVSLTSGVTLNDDGVELYFGIDGHGQLYNDTDPLQMTQKSLYLGDDRTLLFWEDKRFGNQIIDNLNISTSYVLGEVIDSDFGNTGTLNGEKLSESPVQRKPSVNLLENSYLYNFIGQDLSSGEDILKTELLDGNLNFIPNSSESVDGTDWANQKAFIVGSDIVNNQYVFYAKEYWDPSSIWLQIYSPMGEKIHADPINIISNSDGHNYYPRSVFQNPDGGMLLVFDQDENDIRLIGVNSDGSIWNDAVSMIENTENQLFQDAIKTDDGVFITWKDLRGTDADIYSQHIGFEGNVLSGQSNGIALCEQINDQSGANTTFIENTNTVTICWEDFRNGTHWDAYCRSVDLSTHVVSNEIVLSDAIGDQMNPFLFTSLTNTVLVAWEDFRNGSNEYADIYFQEIQNDVLTIADGGISICDEFHNQINPRIDLLTDSSEISYLVYWDDMRSSGKEDLINVFSQQIIIADCADIYGGDTTQEECDACETQVFDCAGECDGTDTSCLSIDKGVPTEFGLMQNYPNPFNPSTSIPFSIPEFSKVSISVYNLNGQKVKSLLQSTMSPGYHQINWYGDDENGIIVSNGIYFYIIETSTFVKKRKMLFIK